MILRRRPAAAILSLAIALTGCGRDRDDGPVDRPVEMAHVHGLGIDPADGRVYVATHHGLFHLDQQGRPVRVGESRQDTMGFTIAGPNHFLGSGHPDPSTRGAEPPLLGLVESTDAGRTWHTRSLKGEADFHALVAAHGRIYGWNTMAGQVLVSADGGTTWDRRATLNLLSFAVDPADPEHLLGSGSTGLVTSRDGGRTWRPAASGPRPGLLAWDRDGGLWAAQSDGVVLASADKGRTWEQRSTLPGQPAALLATKDAVYAATTNERIVRSTDGGRTWTVLYQPA